ICTFGDCLGDYLAVGPEGEIYPCQRFVGLPKFQMGTVHDPHSLEALTDSLAWQTLKAREAHVSTECGGCAYLEFCRGGCPYNALAANSGTDRDPHCAAYQRIFGYITDRALDEVFSEENMDAV